MVHICTGGIQVVKCMLHVTSRGAKAAFKISHLKVGQLNPEVKAQVCAQTHKMGSTSGCHRSRRVEIDRYKSLQAVSQMARTDVNKAFLCELFSHFLHGAKTPFGLMHICWWRSSSHILMLWLCTSVRQGEKYNPWECPSHWGVISCLTVSLKFFFFLSFQISASVSPYLSVSAT